LILFDISEEEILLFIRNCPLAEQQLFREDRPCHHRAMPEFVEQYLILCALMICKPCKKCTEATSKKESVLALSSMYNDGKP